jgi:hypothetical protein
VFPHGPDHKIDISIFSKEGSMYGFRNCLKAAALAVTAFACAGAATAQTWSSPVTIANGNGLAVSTNGSGTSAVIFTPLSGGLQAAVNSGSGWSAPTTFTSISAAANIAVAPNGDVLAVWSFRTTNTYTPVEAQAAFFHGGHWGNTLTLSTNIYGNASSVGLPSIAFDGYSQATVVWEQITNPSPMSCALQAATGSAASGLGPAKTISTASTCFGWNKLTVSSSGQAVAVEGAAGILSAAVVAVGRDSTGAWGAPVTIGAAGVYRQRQPNVGLGNDGTAVVVWLINGGVRYSVRSGGTWSAAAALPGVTGTAGGLSGVAVDGSGNAVATFEQVAISPGTYATYRPVGGSWQTKVQLNSDTQIVATPAGTFVAGGTTVSTRLAGMSNWNQHTFSDVAKVNAAPGLAIAVLGPQVSVSTAAVP